jgi:ribonuclease G
LTEWWIEHGIGEDRAALIDDGRIVEARIRLADDGPGLGAIVEARLGADWRARRLVDLVNGGQAFLDRLAGPATDGATLRVEITREAVRTPFETKQPHVIHRPGGPALRDSDPVAEGCILGAHGPDILEAAGWSELLEEAQTGRVGFPGGTLQIDLTHAMTLIDVDGTGDIDALAVGAATASAQAIRRLDIAGSIGIDFPTVSGRDTRAAMATAFDAALPQPFERTAVNGFGFMQVIRRKMRASLPERLRGDPVGATARALMRRAQRSGLTGATTISAHAAIIARIAENPGWTDRLARELGGPVGLHPDAALVMSGGYVARA